ncbi:MAG: PAS domain-containing protein [Gammaproteobacteria bacterium]|nr:PAS domain-containing protein [Gammaproteobacteria bacterium]
MRFRRLFETAQDGILLINADTAQIEDVNPLLIKLLGYTHGEFLGKKLWQVGSFADVNTPPLSPRLGHRQCAGRDRTRARHSLRLIGC